MLHKTTLFNVYLVFLLLFTYIISQKQGTLTSYFFYLCTELPSWQKKLLSWGHLGGTKTVNFTL